MRDADDRFGDDFRLEDRVAGRRDAPPDFFADDFFAGERFADFFAEDRVVGDRFADFFAPPRFADFLAPPFRAADRFAPPVREPFFLAAMISRS